MVPRPTSRDRHLIAAQPGVHRRGPAEARARLGTRHVPDEELWAITRDAVATFLHAFAAGEHGGE